MGRRYYACRHCKAKATPWESWAGVTGPHRVTPHARRMIVLAGSGCSFDEASRNLAELAHVTVSNDVVRRVCDEEGKAVQGWMNQSPEPQKAFAAAKGVVEFSTDGLTINTVDGWREIRQSVMSKRVAGLPATAAQWDDRALEAPAVRMAICAIAPCGTIGAGWARLARALGLPPEQALSVIADGARWIWAQAGLRFRGKDVQWVVDVYHVMLYLHAAAPAAADAAAAKAWVGARVVELIEMGGPRFIEHLRATGPPDGASSPSPSATTTTRLEPASEMPASPASAPATSNAWDKLLNYLEDNRDSLWYGRRLAEGLPIGSGLIEGGGKSTLARRLKINSARWRVRRAEHMGAIRCLQYSGLWEAYWESQRAAA